jgi:hypothetical protein
MLHEVISHILGDVLQVIVRDASSLNDVGGDVRENPVM